MRGKPDVSGFLEGGAGDLADKVTNAKSKANPSAHTSNSDSEAVKPEPTVQKLFRFRWDTANALKMGAAKESVRTGKRVTETEIVEALVRSHYKIDR